MASLRPGLLALLAACSLGSEGVDAGSDTDTAATDDTCASLDPFDTEGMCGLYTRHPDCPPVDLGSCGGGEDCVLNRCVPRDACEGDLERCGEGAACLNDPFGPGFTCACREGVTWQDAEPLFGVDCYLPPTETLRDLGDRRARVEVPGLGTYVVDALSTVGMGFDVTWSEGAPVLTTFTVRPLLLAKWRPFTGPEAGSLADLADWARAGDARPLTVTLEGPPGDAVSVTLPDARPEVLDVTPRNQATDPYVPLLRVVGTLPWRLESATAVPAEARALPLPGERAMLGTALGPDDARYPEGTVVPIPERLLGLADLGDPAAADALVREALLSWVRDGSTPPVALTVQALDAAGDVRTTAGPWDVVPVEIRYLDATGFVEGRPRTVLLVAPVGL